MGGEAYDLEQNVLRKYKLSSRKEKNMADNVEIVKSGHSSSYGDCWIEKKGVSYIVHLMNNKSEKGPYSTYEAAYEEYRKYCLN